MPKDYETMDLTDPDEIDRDPEMEPVEDEIPDEGEMSDVIDNEEITLEDEPDEPVPEDETPDAAEDEAPDLIAILNERLDGLSQVIDGLLAKIDALALIVDNINSLEEARAAGPSGFFKPVEDDSRSDYAGLPRIEREYR